MADTNSLGRVNPVMCMLAHDLRNKLTIIVGQCELLPETTEPNSTSAKRVHEILELAHLIAKRLSGHECRMTTFLHEIATGSVGENPAVD